MSPMGFLQKCFYYVRPLRKYITPSIFGVEIAAFEVGFKKKSWFKAKGYDLSSRVVR